ncbi:helix-turn-helix domain-containing protein [Micromonospora wenchangensis]|uniref:helix-turn-helix domain-containing protein n=1 Tax=Micromonospora wenchangensis TaxID=1185415 RepID=UPI0038167CEB
MTPSDPRPLGRLITQLRLARGWSQRRLADELCAAAGTATLTRHEVSRWERSVRVPGDRWRRQLAVVLDAPLGPPAAGPPRVHRPTRTRRVDPRTPGRPGPAAGRARGGQRPAPAVGVPHPAGRTGNRPG